MSTKQYCNSCGVHRIVANNQGSICCTWCGYVIDDDIFVEDVGFIKNAAGQSQMQGMFVKSVEGGQSVSRGRTLANAYSTIYDIARDLGMGSEESYAKTASRFYEIALEKNFVRGRRAEQVAATCLYLACRDMEKPYLLIEFSNYLRVNVYVLGAVFLQLCKILHLQEHRVVRKLVDPSFFIHRFVYGLLGKSNQVVEDTAMCIMTSMKRDWMQTGRKPSGLCGAALYISALSHGFKFSKTEVMKAVHICEATLTKRLIEFEDTKSGSLTIAEFHQKAAELENITTHPSIKGNMSKEGGLLCEHKGSDDNPHFAHGLCKACYDKFIELSGGLDGESEPPAFQRAEQERLAKACADENAKISLLDAEQVEITCNTPTIKNATSLDVVGVEQIETSTAIEHGVVDGFGRIVETANDPTGDESDSFSDIDEAEVGYYINSKDEVRLREVIWDHINADYIEEQEQKKAAGILNVPKPKKERQKKTEGMNAKTAAEAAHQILSKKRVSSKLNHDRLKALFDEPVASESPKKSRTESVPEKKNEAEADGEYEEGYNEEDDEMHAYQDQYNDYNEEEYEDFDDGLF